MNRAQEEHLAWLLTESVSRLEKKYRAGDAEHGGPGLMAQSGTALLDYAIEEALDQVTYLLTLRRKANEIELPPKRQTVWTKRSKALRECAAQVWEYLFSESLPDEVQVRWCPHLGRNAGLATIGGMCRGGVVQLDWSFLRTHDNPMSILVHELGHVRGFARHDRRFRAHVDGWLRKLSLPTE